ncbi:MAG: hypothetical protein ACNA8H_12070 [Anaerolineales bacterium]
MSVVLASAWHPRGELSRFERIAPLLHEVYASLVVSVPPEPDVDLVDTLRNRYGVIVVVSPDWSWGRYVAVQAALNHPETHVQYVDFDRLLRWVETRASEWRQIVELTQGVDCLIVGRTDQAYRTHPQALVLTEEISNLVTSHLLGRPMDVSAGCKGFSRRAAEFLIANCKPGNALGTDAEWPVLLHRAGFDIVYRTVDGLDWEIPDQYQGRASGEERQRQQADIYDANPINWERRVEIALEIVRVGLEASTREIVSTNEK